MRTLLLSIVLSASACFSVEIVDGTVQCNPPPGRACPQGYFCAPNGTCYRNGHKPVEDIDMAENDGAGFDLSVTDMTEPDMVVVCGKVDQPCCASGNACVFGAKCDASSVTCVVSDLWAVGADITDIMNIKTVMMHYDGQKWTIGPELSGVNNNYSYLWGDLPTDYYLVGDKGSVKHFDGANWVDCIGGSTCPPTGSSGQLQTVYGLSNKDIWFGGSSETLHLDGFNFVRTTLGLPASYYMTQVCGAKTDDMWAVSLSGSYRWDGSSWHSFANVKAAGCWAASPNDVWSAGNAIQHWDGTAWSGPYMVDGGALPGTISMMHGTATDDVWGIGSDTNSNAVVIHWDGTKWTRTPAGGGTNPSKIFAASKKNAWFFANGLLFHWDGNTWAGVSGLPSRPNTSFGIIWGSATAGR